MQAGPLNRRITLQAQATTQDEYGQPTQSFTDVRTCWASIRAASSKEVYAASGFVSQLTHIITIRYSAAQPVTAGMRIAYSGRSYRVQAVSDPDESRVMQQLLCLEVVNA